MSCGVEATHSTPRQTARMERMDDNDMIRNIYKSGINVGSVRERPLVKWEHTVLEYVRGRGVE